MIPLAKNKKSRVVIYTRVSTDDQAIRGYSLQDQEARLRQYCEIQGHEVIFHFQDDASAKSFDRPAFKELLTFIKEASNNIDLVLFVRWDRFSRKLRQALNMIEDIHELGIRVDAIEQHVDFSVPENKFMLSFYLTAPEVENDRRAMNTRMGMRRAQRNGRWVSKPPKGYVRGRDANDKPLMRPGEQADYIKEAFREIAKGVYSMEEVRRRLIKKGFKCSKNQFTVLLKNPVYYGKIYIKAYNDEPAELVDGLHEPLVSQRLFYKVQNVLNQEAKNSSSKPIRRNESLPLRGLLLCRKCGGNLTGSKTRGNGGYYYYYHCQKGCKERFRADEANAAFLNYLNAIKPTPEVALLYIYIMEDIFREKEGTRDTELKRIDDKMSLEKQRLETLDEKYMDGKLDDEGFARLTKKCNGRIANLKRQRKVIEDTETNFDRYAKYGLTLISDLTHYYEKADLAIKQKIVGLIFPGKLIYENGKYRTNGMNHVMSLLMGKKGDFSAKKEGLTANLDDQSSKVALLGLEPRTS